MSPGLRDLHGRADAAGGRLELHVRRRHHTADDGLHAEERVRVQATHDFIVFGSVALTALTSGAMEATKGGMC